MRITTDDGVELVVEVAGSGPALLMLHGLGGAKEDFAEHVDALARDHTVVIFDHRGHGASDNPRDAAAYSFDRLVADTLTVADALELDRFRLLGHSVGGMVARRVAIRVPERVEALVMMDSSAGPVPTFDPELVEIGVDVALNQGKAALKELLDAFAVLETDAHRRVVERRPGHVEFEAKRWDDVSEIAWGVLARELAHQPDELAELIDPPFPVLVLVGEQDDAFVLASRAMADAIAGARLVVIPDAGHSPQFENPQAWFDALSGFLGALPATPRPAPAR